MRVSCQIKNRFMESLRCKESWGAEVTTDSTFCSEISIVLGTIIHYFYVCVQTTLGEHQNI